MTDLLHATLPTPLQQLFHPIPDNAGVNLFIKRDDEIHPAVSGNKWRKLKYSLIGAKSQNFDTILTFGGAFSNHLYATAAAGNAMGFKTIGIVRGEDAAKHESHTLQFCRQENMQLHFVSRNEYREKSSDSYLHNLSEKFNQPFIIPEGGTSGLALKGVAEMVLEVEQQLGKAPDLLAVAAGTGGTAAGILSTGNNVLAFSALKGGAFLENDINQLLVNHTKTGSLQLLTDYHFGGYAKWDTRLMDFIEDFKNDLDIQLEQVYTGKMFYGLFDLIQKGHFKSGTTIVAVHTGGLQGLLRK